MFARIRNFFYRNRRKFLFTGLVIGGSVLVTRYAQRKFIEWQEKQAKDFIERTRKLQHYESTDRTSNRTIMSLSSSLKGEILETIDTSSHLEKLRNGLGSKSELWEELKVLVFSQHSAFLYSGLMLTIVLKAQLNILGGHMCREGLDSEVKINSSDQNRYLGLCQNFLKEGCVKLCALIRCHVEQVLKDYSLKRMLCIKDAEEIFWNIQTNISNDPKDPMKNVSKYVLTRIEEIDQMDSTLSKIVTETHQVLETDEVVSLLNSCLSSGYSNTLDKIAEIFTGESVSSSKIGGTNGLTAYSDINKNRIPMAKFIPLLHRIVEEMISTEYNDPWILQFTCMERVKNFGANIYEAFSYSG